MDPTITRLFVGLDAPAVALLFFFALGWSVLLVVSSLVPWSVATVPWALVFGKVYLKYPEPIVG
ncbi:MAG: hypothetical protein ACHQF3_07095 [Alphaproteobacteria bacterium]